MRKEIEEWSCLQLNTKDKDLDIQLSDATSKQSYQDRFTKPISGNRQSICIKNKTPASANVMSLISASLFVPKFYVYMVTVLANFNAG